MTHIIKTIIGTLVLSLILSPVAFAETATGTPFRDIRNDIREKRIENRGEVRTASTSEERRDIREENRVEMKNLRSQALSTLKKSIVERHIKKMMERYRAAIERLERLADRILSRITKLEEKGFVLDDAEAKLAEARAAIADAQALATSTEAALEAALLSDDPKTAFKEMRDLIKTLKEKVREAHAKLVEAIKMIKGSRDSNAGNATSTESE